MKLKYYTISFLLTVSCFSSITFGQEKLAQTGMQFLSVISDGRAAALGGAVTSREIQSSSLFFNPATMGFDTTFINASYSPTKWIADINYHSISMAFQPSDGEFGIFGASLQLVDYGTIEGTIVANNDKGYLDYSEMGMSNPEPYALALGFGYAKALSSKFSVGGQVKWVKQYLGETVDTGRVEKYENKLSVMAFDFGTFYRTGFKSLVFGMSVRNFSKEVKYAGEQFPLPLTFSLGISMDLNDLSNIGQEHSFLFSLDAVHVRSASGQVAFALEYQFMKQFFLRGSYITNNNENEYSVGAGVSWYGVQFDYAFSPYGIFGDIQRLTIRFSY